MLEKIEARLSQLIPSRDETLFDGARYALLGPGKRFRPLLTLTTAATFGADPLLALDPACALEMIHTYSLIHDDLPCMDNDELRRGRPTLHKVYGEGMALLIGDYLLTFAFEVMAKAPFLRPEQKLQMIQTVAMRAGSSGMIGGQAIDKESEAREIDEETLLQMHYGKTGALFTACLECGALAAGYPPPPLLQSIGFELGLAYQFQDDLFDATSTTGSDAAKRKPTATSLFGVAATKEKLKTLQKSLFTKLGQLPQNGSELIPLIEPMFRREGRGESSSLEYHH